MHDRRRPADGASSTCSRACRQPGHARLLQVHELRPRHAETPAGRRRGLARAAPRRPAAGRHLLLHLPGDELHDRRVPPPHRADARPHRCSPPSSASSPSSWPGPSSARSTSCRSSRTLSASTWTALAERASASSSSASSRSCAWPTASPRSCYRTVPAARWLRRLGPRARPLRHARGAVPRLRRLHGHRPRQRAPARVSSSSRTSTSPSPSTNPGELWQRWHTSLTVWMRDYVFVAMPGNPALSLLLPAALLGLWHGAALEVRAVGHRQRPGPRRLRALANPPPDTRRPGRQRRWRSWAPSSSGSTRSLLMVLFFCPDMSTAAVVLGGRSSPSPWTSLGDPTLDALAVPRWRSWPCSSPAATRPGGRRGRRTRVGPRRPLRDPALRRALPVGAGRPEVRLPPVLSATIRPSGAPRIRLDHPSASTISTCTPARSRIDNALVARPRDVALSRHRPASRSGPSPPPSRTR